MCIIGQLIDKLLRRSLPICYMPMMPIFLVLIEGIEYLDYLANKRKHHIYFIAWK